LIERGGGFRLPRLPEPGHDGLSEKAVTMDAPNGDLLTTLFFLFLGLAFVALAMGDKPILGWPASRVWSRLAMTGAVIVSVLGYWGEITVPVRWLPLDHQAFYLTVALMALAGVIYGVRELRPGDSD
jgi:hypothetical protein